MVWYVQSDLGGDASKQGLSTQPGTKDSPFRSLAEVEAAGYVYVSCVNNAADSDQGRPCIPSLSADREGDHRGDVLPEAV